MGAWEAAQQRITKAWYRRDYETALLEIAAILASDPAHSAQALVYRGMIRESQGDFEAAKEDWLQAISHAPEGSYTRYVAERSVGTACEQLGRVDEARRWYRAAMMTCAEGDAFSGGNALAAFLASSQGRLTAEDEALATKVATKSWGILELPGKPDVTDLMKVAASLTKSLEP